MGLNKIMINEQKPQNLFCTKHFLAVMAVFYMTTLNPAIDSWIDGNMTKKDIGKLFNALIVTIVGASLKVFDKDVYTPKFIPGRNKDKALDNINELLSPTVNEVRKVVLETVKEAVNNNNINTDINKSINNITTDTLNTIIPANNIQSNIAKDIINNTISSATESFTSNINTDINNKPNKLQNKH